MTTARPSASPPKPESLWQLWYERHHGKALRESGADPEFVGRLIASLTYPPDLRRLQRLTPYLAPKEIDGLVNSLSALLASIESLERLRADPAFAELQVFSRHDIHRLLRNYHRKVRDINTYFRQAQHRADADDPLLPLLRHDSPSRRRRGKPAHSVATLFMVLLADHLRERTGKPSYRNIGHIAAKLFPGCLEARVLNVPSKLRTAVQDRCKKFTQGHDVPRLRTAVLSIVEG